MNCDEWEMVKKAAFLVVSYYPWFLKSYISDTAIANDQIIL